MKLFNKKSLLVYRGKSELQIFRKRLLDYLFNSYTRIEWGEMEYLLDSIVVVKLEQNSDSIRAKFFEPSSVNNSQQNGHIEVGKTEWITPGDNAEAFVFAVHYHLIWIEQNY